MKRLLIALFLTFATTASIANENPQVLVIRSKEFSSVNSVSCNNFLCLARRMQGFNPLSPNKFSSSIALGIELECNINKKIGQQLLKVVCSITIDPSKTEEGIELSLNEYPNHKVVTAKITKSSILNSLYMQMRGLPFVFNLDRITLDAETEGKEIERMQLTCLSQEGKPAFSSCTLSGATN